MTQTTQVATTTKALFAKATVQKRFEKLLGDKAAGFITSVLQTVQNSDKLAAAKPETILNAAATAAALDLPITQSLGFAWIVAYKDEAQFQMGWKGFVQLALRTKQYKAMNVIEVYKNQFKSFNVMTEELDADFEVEGKGEIVGYAGYFELNGGFKKTVYWSKKKVIEHAKKYSKTFGKKNQKGHLMHSPWNDKDQFDAMAKKTVLKNMISKWGIMSIEMQKAHVVDQAVLREENEPDYVDANVVDVAEKKEVIEKNETPTPDLP